MSLHLVLPNSSLLFSPVKVDMGQAVMYMTLMRQLSWSTQLLGSVSTMVCHDRLRFIFVYSRLCTGHAGPDCCKFGFCLDGADLDFVLTHTHDMKRTQKA